MSAISVFFDSVGAWFGFVGSCIASPSGACVPFLVFLASGVAAGIALALLLRAYRYKGNVAQAETRSDALHIGASSPRRERPGARPRADQTPAAA
jgi:hypothetical protein